MEEGCFYHIYNRGINRGSIFFETRNFDYFLKQFDRYLFMFLDVYSYCLMPNHFHILVKIKELKHKTNNLNNSFVKQNQLTSIEQAFRDFFICYAKTINKEYKRTGALFQFKYKRKYIKNGDYLKRLLAYIHLNPVRAGLCENPNDWKYSSYNSFLSPKRTKIKRGEVLIWFEKGKDEFVEFHNNYRDFQKERDFIFKDSIIQ